MRAMLIALALVTVIAGGARAEDRPKRRTDSSSLEIQIRDLKEQVRKLKAAIARAAALNKQSAEALLRGVEGAASAGGGPAGQGRARNSKAKASTKKRRTRGRGTIQGTIRVPAGEPVAYAYVENVYAPPVKGKKVVIDQRGKQFIPSWAVVRRGTKIEFPNHDNIYHNVFSPSPGNTFDLGLYSSGTPGKSHAFRSPGAADIYCNIHPKMAASVLVVPNKHFARVKPDGSFVIRNVPVGQRKLVAWSPRSRTATEWVELASGGTAVVALKLESKSGAHKNKAGRAYGSYP